MVFQTSVISLPICAVVISLILLWNTCSNAHNTTYPNDGENTVNLNDRIEKKFKEDPSTLLLVQVIFRHGDRSPLTSYPTDPHKNAWAQGYGHLTKVGMHQGLELGKYLAGLYSGFLSPEYNPNEVYIRSSDKDRTLMMAQCVVAGLFPPPHSYRNELEPFSMWQPIPIHTVPRKLDIVLRPSKACKYVSELKYGLRAFFYSKQRLMMDKDMMFTLSKHSHLEMNFTTLRALADTVFCQKLHNFSLPKWMSHNIEDSLINFQHLLPPLMPEEAKYLAGILLENLISNMLTKVHNTTDKHKLYLYSGHEGNLHSLMSLLSVFNKDTDIPYAAAIIFELHKIGEKLRVKLLYKRPEDTAPSIFKPNGCKTDLCPMSSLTDVFDEPIYKSWEDVCGVATKENVIDFGDNTIPILVSVLVAFAGLALFLLYKTFHYRQQINRRKKKVSYALVRTNANSSSDEDSELSAKELCLSSIHANNGVRKTNGSARHKSKGKSYRLKSQSGNESDSFEETDLFVPPSRHS